MKKLNLKHLLVAWNTPWFESQLKQSIESLSYQELPLQQGLSYSSYALDDSIQMVLMSSQEIEQALHLKLGLFYSGVVAGCNCANDPSPIDIQAEYCEILLELDKITGDVEIRLLLT